MEALAAVCSRHYRTTEVNGVGKYARRFSDERVRFVGFGFITNR